jgi:hypothetical protein
MKKKYFTEEEKKAARKLESKKYYNKFRKQTLTKEEKENKKLEQKEKRKKYEKEYYQKNKEKILEQSRLYFKDNQKIKQEKNNKRYKDRRNTDPVFKLSMNIKRNIRANMNKKSFTKKSRTREILGCSYEDFKQHIESLWEPWMTWDNYGHYNGESNYGWDIDHIIPSSLAITENDVIKLNHYTNLRPLCSYYNRNIKRDNVITVVKDNNLSKVTLK